MDLYLSWVVKPLSVVELYNEYVLFMLLFIFILLLIWLLFVLVQEAVEFEAGDWFIGYSCFSKRL